MFWKKRYKMENLSGIKPTSKMALKMQCLTIAKGDLDEAERLYQFVSNGIDMPDFDPIEQSTIVKVKDTALGIFGWVKENKGEISDIVDFIRSFKGVAKGASSAPIPPINQ